MVIALALTGCAAPTSEPAVDGEKVEGFTAKALFRNNVVLSKHFYVGNELESTKLFLNDP